jgi:hypothetical protein
MQVCYTYSCVGVLVDQRGVAAVSAVARVTAVEHLLRAHVGSVLPLAFAEDANAI